MSNCLITARSQLAPGCAGQVLTARPHLDGPATLIGKRVLAIGNLNRIYPLHAILVHGDEGGTVHPAARAPAPRAAQDRDWLRVETRRQAHRRGLRIVWHTKGNAYSHQAQRQGQPCSGGSASVAVPLGRR